MRHTNSYPRVLQVTPRYFPFVGGVETHVREVSRRLARAGVDVTVLTTDPRGRLPRDEVMEGVRIRRVRAWPASGEASFAPELRHVIAEGGWDLIHCQGYHTLVAPLALLAARQAGIPAVVTFHSGGASSRARAALRHAQWAALRPLLAGARTLIGVSTFEADAFQRRLRLPAERFRVVSNGVNPPPAVARAALAAANREVPVIVSAGRLVRYKGHQRVIAAMPKVLDHRPTAHLRIIGVGPYEGALRRQVRRLGLERCVTIGAVPPDDTDAMARLFARAALVTLLSEHEGQGLVVLEALALGRPVLVAASSALRAYAERGLARAVPLDSSASEVAAAILDQLQEPLVPRNVRLPTWEECAERLLEIYLEAMEGPRCASCC